MVNHAPEVRHVVAWLPAVRVTICITLWAVFATAWLLPDLQLPLREIVAAGLASAACRTLVLLADHAWIPRWHFWRGLALAADALLMTGLLDITGGPFNPFLVVLAVYVWLAKITLSASWAVVVGLTVASGLGWLVIDHLQAGFGEHHRLADFPTHLFTMCFTAASVMELVAHYVTRARAAMAQRQDEVNRARDQATRSEHLASLMTLAAGAAHELSTPLATIAVAAGELARNARVSRPDMAALEADAHLIQSSVSRCQDILDGMSGRATATMVAAIDLTPSVIVRLATQDLAADRRPRLQIEIDNEAAPLAVASADAARALASLVKNAFDASGPADRVLLRVERLGSMLRFAVHDHGAGMSEEVRRRAGEPFFTTKPLGGGLGLGLFLARTIAEQAAGSLQFDFSHGTTAMLDIPLLSAPEAR